MTENSKIEELSKNNLNTTKNALNMTQQKESKPYQIIVPAYPKPPPSEEVSQMQEQMNILFKKVDEMQQTIRLLERRINELEIQQHKNNTERIEMIREAGKRKDQKLIETKIEEVKNVNKIDQRQKKASSNRNCKENEYNQLQQKVEKRTRTRNEQQELILINIELIERKDEIDKQIDIIDSNQKLKSIIKDEVYIELIEETMQRIQQLERNSEFETRMTSMEKKINEMNDKGNTEMIERKVQLDERMKRIERKVSTFEKKFNQTKNSKEVLPNLELTTSYNHEKELENYVLLKLLDNGKLVEIPNDIQ